MKRVRIIGPQSASARVIKLVKEMGALHVITPGRDKTVDLDWFDTGVFSERSASRLKRGETLASDIICALDALPGVDVSAVALARRRTKKIDWLSEKTAEKIQLMVGDISEASHALELAREELKEVSGYHRIFSDFLPLVEMVATSVDVELVGVSFPQKDDDALNELKTKIDEVTSGAFSLFESSETPDGISILVVIPAYLKNEVTRNVFGERIRPVHVPERYGAASFAMMMKRLFERRAELGRQIATARRTLSALSDERLDDLLLALSGVNGALADIRAQNLVAHSGKVFRLVGWIPAAESVEFAQKINERFGGAVMVYISEPSVDERFTAPVKLENPRWAKPFERFIHLYSLPSYGDIDPTVIMAITFPLFFGMMLGDIGYAVILAGTGFFIKTRWKGDALAGDVGDIIGAVAFSSALFGLLYGEMFGKLWSLAGFWAPVFDRKENADMFLNAVLVTGVLHVSLGAAFGAVNHARRGFAGKALEKIADCALVLSALAIAWLAWRGEDFGAVVFIPAMALVVKMIAGRDLTSAIEVSRLVSSVLSYARLMALGMASLVMADLANDIFINSGWAVVGLAGAICFHSLNFVMGVVSPAIQAGRLHYVEFFTQFYEPGGVAYAPLRKT